MGLGTFAWHMLSVRTVGTWNKDGSCEGLVSSLDTGLGQEQRPIYCKQLATFTPEMIFSSQHESIDAQYPAITSSCLRYLRRASAHLRFLDHLVNVDSNLLYTAYRCEQEPFMTFGTSMELNRISDLLSNPSNL